MAAVHQCANVAIYAWDETQEVMEEGREYCSVDSRGTIKCFASNHPRGNSCKISSYVVPCSWLEYLRKECVERNIHQNYTRESNTSNLQIEKLISTLKNNTEQEPYLTITRKCLVTIPVPLFLTTPILSNLSQFPRKLRHVNSNRWTDFTTILYHPLPIINPLSDRPFSSPFHEQ